MISIVDVATSVGRGCLQELVGEAEVGKLQ